MSGRARPPEGGVLAVIDRVVSGVTLAFAGLGVLALAGILILMLAAVVRRYIWSAPLAFTEELSGLLLGVAVFALLPYTAGRELNIRVTILSARIGVTAGRVLFVAGQAVLVAFTAIFAWQAWQITAFTQRLNLLSEQARLPLTPFLYVTLAGIVLVGLVAVWRAVRPIAGSDGPPV